MENFQAVLDYLASVRNINYGGCGFSAYAMYLWLEKRGMLSKDATVVYGYDSTLCGYKRNVDFLNGNSNVAGACDHVALFNEGKFFDSSGELEADWGYGINTFIFVPIDKLHKFMEVSLQCSWNSSFERDKYVPKIQKKLEIDFGIKKYQN